MDESKHAVHAEEAQVGKKKRGCCCSWCRWYYWVGGVLLFILVVLLIIFLGVVPAVAQKSVDKTYLELDALNIVAPRPDGFVLSIDSTIKGAKIHGAKLDGFNADFLLNDKGDTFMKVDIPKVSTEDEIPVEVKDIDTTVTDNTAFMNFAHTLMESEKLDVKIKGKTKIHIGKLSAKVDYNEVITMKGLNKLKGMAVVGYKLVEDSKDHNLEAEILIPNPTVVTLQLGDVDIEMFSKEKSFGNGTLPNLILTPGNNNYTFRGQVDIRTLLGLVINSGGKPAYFQVKGKKVSYKGVDIPWLKEPLAANFVDVQLGHKV